VRAAKVADPSSVRGGRAGAGPPGVQEETKTGRRHHPQELQNPPPPTNRTPPPKQTNQPPPQHTKRTPALHTNLTKITLNNTK
jgi:hypothetical protein